MKSFALSISLALFTLSFVACDDEEKDSYPPTYAGFDYSPKPVSPGDELTVIAVQAKQGHLLNACTYTLNVPLTVEKDGNPQDTTIVSSYHTNYDGTYNGNPTFTFRIPANTISTSSSVTFSARWENSANGAGGDYYSTDDPAYLGTITSRCYVLYSNAAGSFTLPIKQ